MPADQSTYVTAIVKRSTGKVLDVEQASSREVAAWVVGEQNSRALSADLDIEWRVGRVVFDPEPRPGQVIVVPACECGHARIEHRNESGDCMERDRSLPCGCSRYRPRTTE